MLPTIQFYRNEVITHHRRWPATRPAGAEDKGQDEAPWESWQGWPADRPPGEHAVNPASCTSSWLETSSTRRVLDCTYPPSEGTGLHLPLQNGPRNFLEHLESPRLQDQAVMLRFMRPICLVLPPAPGLHLPPLKPPAVRSTTAPRVTAPAVFSPAPEPPESREADTGA